MKADDKHTSPPGVARESGLVSVRFGSVTVQVTQAPESIRKANIIAGQEALQRGKQALVTPGVKLTRQKRVPLYFGCEDRPGWMIRELDGKQTIGRFVGGRFRPEAQSPVRKRSTKAP